MSAVSDKEYSMGWQLTAITIYCDAVDDEVTIILHKDGAITCTDYRKYTEPSKETDSGFCLLTHRDTGGCGFSYELSLLV